jgi:hypothetical protein
MQSCEPGVVIWTAYPDVQTWDKKGRTFNGEPILVSPALKPPALCKLPGPGLNKTAGLGFKMRHLKVR